MQNYFIIGRQSMRVKENKDFLRENITSDIDLIKLIEYLKQRYQQSGFRYLALIKKD